MDYPQGLIEDANIGVFDKYLGKFTGKHDKKIQSLFKPISKTYKYSFGQSYINDNMRDIVDVNLSTMKYFIANLLVQFKLEQYGFDKIIKNVNLRTTSTSQIASQNWLHGEYILDYLDDSNNVVLSFPLAFVSGYLHCYITMFINYSDSIQGSCNAKYIKSKANNEFTVQIHLKNTGENKLLDYNFIDSNRDISEFYVEYTMEYTNNRVDDFEIVIDVNIKSGHKISRLVYLVTKSLLGNLNVAVDVYLSILDLPKKENFTSKLTYDYFVESVLDYPYAHVTKYVQDRRYSQKYISRIQ